MDQTGYFELGIDDLLSRFPKEFSKTGCTFTYQEYLYEVFDLYQHTEGYGGCVVCSVMNHKLKTEFNRCWKVKAVRIWPTTSEPVILEFGLCSPLAQISAKATEHSKNLYMRHLKKESKGSRWEKIEVLDMETRCITQKT